VSLSGAKGTRYLKTSFSVYSSNPDAKKIIEDHRNELQDVALGVLSAKTIADLEGAGAQNTVRNELIENFNQVLKSNLIERVFFSEFVTE
jgi:flagellar basal body-associated protein FliL